MSNTIRLCLIGSLSFASVAAADYRSDVGYGELQALLGAGIPSGAGVKVAQIEASEVQDPKDGRFPIYAPRTSDFPGKNFSFPGSRLSTAISGHATGVGARFYGNSGLAMGITDIASYEVIDWATTLISATATAPYQGGRIANHSWVASSEKDIESATVLRIVDRQVHINEFIQVAAMDNRINNAPLLGSAYNVIAVGRTDGLHDRGSDAVDSVYASGRTRPDLVAPQNTTSAATPVVAAAAALLMETGHNGATNLSKGSLSLDGIGTVYNAERSETVKAALMAGADRVTANTSTTANIIDYRSRGHQTVNGLDDRFGAGQLNVFKSYEIISAGEQNSLEDGGSPGGIHLAGFDFDSVFGGVAGNSTATYKITALTDLNLKASLVWNLGVSNDTYLTATLHDLNLELFDSTTDRLLATSASSVDNSENLWLELAAGHNYELRVKAAGSKPFDWDYALAWHMTSLQVEPVPVPAAVYLFLSAIGGWLASRAGSPKSWLMKPSKGR